MEIIDRKIEQTLITKHGENLEESTTDDHSIVQPRTNGSLITRSLLEIFIVLRVNGALWQKRAKLEEINVFPVKRSSAWFFTLPDSGTWPEQMQAFHERLVRNLLDEYFVPLVATGFPLVQLSTRCFQLCLQLDFNRDHPIPGSIF